MWTITCWVPSMFHVWPILWFTYSVSFTSQKIFRGERKRDEPKMVWRLNLGSLKNEITKFRCEETPKGAWYCEEGLIVFILWKCPKCSSATQNRLWERRLWSCLSLTRSFRQTWLHLWYDVTILIRPTVFQYGLTARIQPVSRRQTRVWSQHLDDF